MFVFPVVVVFVVLVVPLLAGLYLSSLIDLMVELAGGCHPRVGSWSYEHQKRDHLVLLVVVVGRHFVRLVVVHRDLVDQHHHHRVVRLVHFDLIESRWIQVP